MKNSIMVLLSVIVSLLLVLPANATIITEGFTFSVASAEYSYDTGTHFHSSTGGEYGNPAGKAEVGRFKNEEVRGLSEYDLTGLSSSPTAFVTFNVYSLVGLFVYEYPFPFGDHNIDIYSYAGNNTEDISDYQEPMTGLVGNFTTGGLSVGDILSFDITSIFNYAIDQEWTSLGIRLQAMPLNNLGAMVFDNFRLTTTDQTTTDLQPIPEPSTMLLFGIGIIGLALFSRRKIFN
ncbi:PEP-CTERM sorting domain-containing protein [Desulfonatronovibrio hydrogenovorans]|uniref:PEP-CTERM sorting domain-containing protein n=1 Tax=Desulfonatronovibrio hydrogenovorans TaxID=53245 RepID=UPI00048A8A7C|nr:PEP-CTERM sorting domain-containing protein [Desulfonatronovibrio hydrogenovorans]